MSNQTSDSTTCKIVCFLIGLAAAAVAWYFLSPLLSAIPLFLICLFTLFMTAYFMMEGFCGGAGIPGEDKPDVSIGSVSTDPKTIRAIMGGETAQSAPDTTASLVSGSAVSETKTTAKASSASASSKPARKSAAKTTAKPKAAAKTKAAAKSKPAAKGPKLFTSPPKQVDDLKMIAGVGPKLEKTLNNLGVYQWKQVASWKKSDIAHVDERLKFKGRIERDDWVKQAKALAKGGEAEYIKVFGKKPR